MESVVTRFAPSPSGELHLGNVRTALFNLLLARRSGGELVLRIEDTDVSRSHEDFTRALLADLRWLGIEWNRGPEREDARGPYLQSARAELYARYFAELEAKNAVYACFCSPVELEVARRAQLAAGRPPRYAGTCRDLNASQIAQKRAAGREPSLRFRVPSSRRIEFADFVHGAQSFLSDDIGDFIVRRADGSPAFFFSNAIDDAHMGVTHVLRGEDHLTNTPRQLLILEGLGLRAPAYGHVALLVGRDGAPLSKRHGASSVGDYRKQGFLAGAILNLLFRLGHSSSENGFLDLAQMAQAFDTRHLGRAPAHFDEQQLRTWQKEAVHRLSPQAALEWLRPVLPADLDSQAALAFVEAVLPNVILPADAQAWAQIVFGDPPALDSSEAQVIRGAGDAYFAAAAAAAARSGNDLPAIVGAVRAATGFKGAALYQPLRVALTGRLHGPELAPLLKAMPPGKARERLQRYARGASGEGA